MKRTVYFRAFEEEDAPLIYQWMNDDELKELSIGINRRLCKEEALDWVRTRMKYNPYEIWWAICSFDSNTIIGYISLTNIHYINSSANFSGIVIGDRNYQDGFAWIESYLFLYDYAFERLGLNRVYGEYLTEHTSTNLISSVFFTQKEGVLREAYFKNGRFYDAVIASLLKKDYFEHKKKGDFELETVYNRMLQTIREYRRKKIKK